MTRPSIYRSRALAAWAERREVSVLPRLALPWRLRALWVALLLLLAAGAAVLIPLLREAGG